MYLFQLILLQDGEWGGNVEIVVASRVYKRNIMVFSGEYSNGALSIICNDKDEDGNDLLLAYHGNDHYNSVHPIIDGGFNKQSTKSLSNGPPSLATTKKKGKMAIDDKNKNEKKEETGQSIVEGKKSRSRPPTRGSNCPCRSGLKYKKCCMAQEKSKKKLAKHMEKHGANSDSADNTDEKKEDEFIGEFKVLTI
mmetsp:Transcript_458/g.906  ORF Transcript_458/g.906 Transcript_458/m.906 type:complete len:194 (-) Transcript_458:1606-2187(-)